MNKEKQNICVHVRIRPLNKSEIIAGSVKEFSLVTKDEIHCESHGKTYVFDQVYDEYASQEQVYNASVQPLLDDVIKGFNVTVFAYGQTGTGKTYTMGGGSVNTEGTYQKEDPNTGIIPRAVIDIFKALEDKKAWTLKVSFLELYNEVLSDLLDDNKREIRIMEKEGKNICFPNPDKPVHSTKELFHYLHLGISKRCTAYSKMNDVSSRSHAVFSLSLEVRNSTVTEKCTTYGKINFVDLAGSENISKSGAVNIRASEAGKINQSLLAIGRVINALVDKNQHIPYRESKLTRILQDSLGGNTKTTLIATVSPSKLNTEETLKTLDYAQRAKKIKNRPDAKKTTSITIVMGNLMNEIERLQRNLEAQRLKKGMLLSMNAYNELIGLHSFSKQEVEDRAKDNVVLLESIEKLEAKRDSSLMELEETRNYYEELVENCKQNKKDLQMYKRKNKEGHIVLRHIQGQFGKLQDEAKAILEVAKKTKKNEDILLEKVNMLYEISQKNANTTNCILGRVRNSRSMFQQNIQELQKSINDNASSFMQAIVENINYSNEDCSSKAFDRVEELKKSLAKLSQEHQEIVKKSVERDLEVSKCIEEQLRNNTNESFCELASLMDDFETSLGKLKEDEHLFNVEIKDHLTKMKDIQEEFAKMNEEHLLEFYSTISEVGDYINTKLRAQDQLYQQQNEKSNQFSEFVLNNVQALESQIQSFREGTQESTDALLRGCAHSQELNSEVKSSIDQLEKKYANYHEDSIAECSKRIQIFEDTCSSFETSCQMNIDRLKEHEGDLSRQVKEKEEIFTKLTRVEVHKLVDEINKSLELKQSTLANYLEKSNTEFKDTHEVTQVYAEEVLKDAESNIHGLGNLRQKVLQSSDCFDEDLNQHGSNERQLINKITDGIQYSIQHEYGKIQHQGDTPQKQESLPKKLTKIERDHQKVIQQYRSEVNGSFDGENESFVEDKENSTP